MADWLSTPISCHCGIGQRGLQHALLRDSRGTFKAFTNCRPAEYSSGMFRVRSLWLLSMHLRPGSRPPMHMEDSWERGPFLAAGRGRACSLEPFWGLPCDRIFGPPTAHHFHRGFIPFTAQTSSPRFFTVYLDSERWQDNSWPSLVKQPPLLSVSIRSPGPTIGTTQCFIPTGGGTRPAETAAARTSCSRSSIARPSPLRRHQDIYPKYPRFIDGQRTTARLFVGSQCGKYRGRHGRCEKTLLLSRASKASI